MKLEGNVWDKFDTILIKFYISLKDKKTAVYWYIASHIIEVITLLWYHLFKSCTFIRHRSFYNLPSPNQTFQLMELPRLPSWLVWHFCSDSASCDFRSSSTYLAHAAYRNDTCLIGGKYVRQNLTNYFILVYYCIRKQCTINFV